MAIKQISVFVENKQGVLSEAVAALAEAGVNLRALSIADTQEFGILRIIVSDTDKAVDVLRESTIVKVTDVIAVKMDDEQGALHNVLKVLEDAKINIDYSYAFTGSKSGAYVVIRVDSVDDAQKALEANGVTVLNEEDVASI